MAGCAGRASVGVVVQVARAAIDRGRARQRPAHAAAALSRRQARRRHAGRLGRHRRAREGACNRRPSSCSRMPEREVVIRTIKVPAQSAGVPVRASSAIRSTACRRGRQQDRSTASRRIRSRAIPARSRCRSRSPRAARSRAPATSFARQASRSARSPCARPMRQSGRRSRCGRAGAGEAVQQIRTAPSRSAARSPPPWC